MKIASTILLIAALGFSSGCQMLPSVSDIGQARGLALEQIRERYRTFRPKLPERSFQTLESMTAEMHAIPKSMHPEFQILALQDRNQEIWYLVCEYREELGQPVFVRVFNSELQPRMHWSAPQTLSDPFRQGLFKLLAGRNF